MRTLVGSRVAIALGGSALVVLATLALASGTTGRLIVVAAALTVAVLRFPALGVSIYLIVAGFGLLVPILGVSSSVLSAGTAMLLGVAAAGSMLRRSRPSVGWAIALLAVIIAFGAIVGTSALPSSQVISGAVVLVTPALFAFVAVGLSRNSVVLVLRLMTLIVCASAIASAAEFALGPGALVRAGLDYGTSVRTYQGILRAPGLFATNYALGSFAGVAGALAIVWWRYIEPRTGHWWRIATFVGAIACLGFSIYRTGMVVFAVAVLTWVMLDASRGKVSRRLAAVVMLALLAAVVFVKGLVSTSSLHDRLAHWATIPSQYGFPLLGHGLGFSGVASGNQAAVERVVVDNYFINIALQLGVVGIVFLIALTLITVRTLRATGPSPMMSSGAVLLSAIIAFFFVDFWEYGAAMGLVFFAVASSYSLSQRDVGGAISTSGVRDETAPSRPGRMLGAWKASNE